MVIGASAGGFKAITDLLCNFPEQDSVTVFVVLHISKSSMSEVIVHHFQKHTSLTCKVPVNGEQIQARYLYVAPADHHMLVKNGEIVVHDGPHENRWRPSIDVLFRSAAVAYNSAVIGIVLSGLLDDGTSGMGAIKRSGGICIVQEPNEAEFSDMPNNVLNNVDVDYRVSVADMEYILQDLFSKPAAEPVEVPPEIKLEAQLTERLSTKIQDLGEIADHSIFNCPDCGGGLWKIKNDTVARYRCHTGHVYTEKVLMQVQSEEIEETLWVAIRLLEERRNLLLNVANHEKQAGLNGGGVDKNRRSEEVAVHIERLKSVLQSINMNEPND